MWTDSRHRPVSAHHCQPLPERTVKQPGDVEIVWKQGKWQRFVHGRGFEEAA